MKIQPQNYITATAIPNNDNKAPIFNGGLVAKTVSLISNPNLNESDRRVLYSGIAGDMQRLGIPLTDKEINNLTDKAWKVIDSKK